MSIPTEDSIPTLAKHLSTYTIAPNDIQISQLVHRLHILQKWFSPAPPSHPLSNTTILEIGCGQGDMTVALAHHLPPSTTLPKQAQILALDPAPLSYGGPYTLGESQAHITNSALGSRISWVQAEPREYLSHRQNRDTDFVVLAHSVFYLPSEEYLLGLLSDCLRNAGEGRAKLLVAEWGMRESGPGTRAHLLAVRAQEVYRSREGNVRCVITPERFGEMAVDAGWKLDREEWIESPEVDDGRWEVDNLRDMIDKEGVRSEAKALVDEMEQAIERDGETKAMDVWTAVFVPAA